MIDVYYKTFDFLSLFGSKTTYGHLIRDNLFGIIQI